MLSEERYLFEVTKIGLIGRVVWSEENRQDANRPLNCNDKTIDTPVSEGPNHNILCTAYEHHKREVVELNNRLAQDNQTVLVCSKASVSGELVLSLLELGEVKDTTNVAEVTVGIMCSWEKGRWCRSTDDTSMHTENVLNHETFWMNQDNPKGGVPTILQTWCSVPEQYLAKRHHWLHEAIRLVADIQAGPRLLKRSYLLCSTPEPWRREWNSSTTSKSWPVWPRNLQNVTSPE